MNLPIEMICVCSSDGSITPLRFRLEDERKCLQTVAVTRVISCKPIEYVGIESIEYLCMAKIGGHERLYALRYSLRTHRWSLLIKGPS